MSAVTKCVTKRFTKWILIQVALGLMYAVTFIVVILALGVISSYWDTYGIGEEEVSTCFCFPVIIATFLGLVPWLGYWKCKEKWLELKEECEDREAT